jgi:hypothetical protein
MKRYDAGLMRLWLGLKARGTKSPTVSKWKHGLLDMSHRVDLV